MGAIQTIVSEKRRHIDARLVELVSDDTTSATVMGALEPTKYLCSSGGKRLRPILLLLSCQALGGDPQKALDAAVAMEMIHSSSLIFDDLIDLDSTRRRRKTVHVRFGEGRAIGVGLFLASRATQIMALYRDERIDNRFAEALVQLSKGELMGVMADHENDFDVYLEIAKLKTSSLFMASASIGALLGGGTEDQVEAMSEYGRFVGLAFQIRDDIMDSQLDNTNVVRKLSEAQTNCTDGLTSSCNSQASIRVCQSKLHFSVESAEQIADLCTQKANSQVKRLNIPADHTRLLEDFANYAWARNS